MPELSTDYQLEQIARRLDRVERAIVEISNHVALFRLGWVAPNVREIATELGDSKAAER
jgi:hypothetical protein